jgi:hypothetical protein
MPRVRAAPSAFMLACYRPVYVPVCARSYCLIESYCLIASYCLIVSSAAALCCAVLRCMQSSLSAYASKKGRLLCMQNNMLTYLLTCCL